MRRCHSATSPIAESDVHDKIEDLEERVRYLEREIDYTNSTMDCRTMIVAVIAVISYLW